MDARTIALGCALETLATNGWFSKRSAKTRAKLSAIAKLRSYAKGDRVYLAGDPPNGMFGLVSGSLNLSIPRADGEDYPVHRAVQGFWLGDLALFSKGPRLVSVHAAETTLMVELPSHDLSRLVEDDPRLYADFYALTYENFRVAFDIISNLAMTATDKRVADRLMIEARTCGDADGWIPLSLAELASLTAVSLPTLKRIVRRFVEAGFIDHRYARIRICDKHALTRFCRG